MDKDYEKIYISKKEEYNNVSSKTLILDAICQFGKNWLLEKMSITQSEIDAVCCNNMPLADDIRNYLIHFLCAAEMEKKYKNRSDNTILYFAYGSNMNINQMLHDRCPGANDLGAAILYDYEVKERKYADIDYVPGKKVFGVLYCISQEHKEILDKKEGVINNIYYSKYVQVEHCGKFVNAMVYIYTDATKEARKNIPYESKIRDYRNICSQGAVAHGVPDCFQK